MFITFQFPFVDLRCFLQGPPTFVPNRPSFPNHPHIDDFEKVVDDKVFVRCFGSYHLRGYVPKFGDEEEAGDYPPQWALQGEGQWYDLNKCLWQDEYLYVLTRRGLRFKSLEKQKLLKGKLVLPRVKIRALRFSPFNPSHTLWSPCIRIETGVLYKVSERLEGSQLVKALCEFIKLKVNVPTYKRDATGHTALVVKCAKLKSDPLIDQQKTLARLIVSATTVQKALKTHEDMVIAGKPLITVHYFPDELCTLPGNSISLPASLIRNMKIAYYPLRDPKIGVWLFQMPHRGMRRAIAAKKRVIIRNYTIAIMRYWSELQAMLALRRAVLGNTFEFHVRKNDLLHNYVNKATRFLMSDSWHGSQLSIIRNVMSAYHLTMPDKQIDMFDALNDFRRQIGEKLKNISKVEKAVFVSYNRKDGNYLSTIRDQLIFLLTTKQITYFDDTYIEEGEEWEKEILNHLDNSSVAILLVSKHFCQSEYIERVERPRILDRYQRGKLKVIPVLIDGDIPEDRFFSNIQFLNAQCPLSTATQEEIKNIVRNLFKGIQQKFQNSEM